MHRRLATTPVDDEFIGVVDQISESFFDLLDQGSETGSESGSSDESHHPSRECHMVQLMHVPVQARAEQANPAVNAPVNAVVAGAPLHPAPGGLQE